MPARLIINADDFGLTAGINRAIAELHAAGALTSATLMANGAAFDDAVSIARQNPTLGVGCHLVLIDGMPISPPESIPTLCPNGRTFRGSLIDFTRNLLMGWVSVSDIEREALAQIEKIQSAGIQLTHLDTHKHTHIFPAVTSALANILPQTGIAAIRNPFEPRHTLSHAPFKRRLQIAALDTFHSRYNRIAQNILTTDGTFGISATGSLNAESLLEILRAVPGEGTYELLCHPGYNDSELDAVVTRLRDHREEEYAALLAEVPKISSDQLPLQLIHYGDL